MTQTGESSAKARGRSSGRTHGAAGSVGALGPENIVVRGARQHNLQIDLLEIPKHRFVVLTGVSGSGKSSLAFDTLYAEGQRRYVETLSAYARQFLGQMDRPAVEHIRGLSPTIAIEQKSASSNPRSTVGTITEVLDYLRVLYARVGVQHCPTCGERVSAASRESILADIVSVGEGSKLTVLAPLVENRKGEFRDLFDGLRGKGFVRVRVNGKILRLDEEALSLDKKKKHTIDLVVDRIAAGPDTRGRLAEAVELGLREGDGALIIEAEGAAPRRYSSKRFHCDTAFRELSPPAFSFNSPLGMCPECSGLGAKLDIDPELVIPDTKKSIRDGAILPWATAMARGEGWTFRIADAVAKACGVDLDTPWHKLGKAKQDKVLFGLEGTKVAVQWGKEGTESHGTWGMKFQGVIPMLLRRFHQSTSETAREQYKAFMREVPCSACGGRRLKPESLAVRVAGVGIADVCAMPVARAAAHIARLDLSPTERAIATSVVREIETRLTFLLDVGLDYLTLDRSGPTLSGGEAQRIRLASQLGSELSGVMYVLDEPSIGLHPRDNERLLRTLIHLRDLGNTVLVVEHDEETILAADHVVDFGPGAGHMGGRVLYAGPPEGLLKSKESLTGAYLSGRRKIAPPRARRTPKGELTVIGATEHNLKNIDVRFPLGVLTAVTGVSGAGKSSLVSSILLPALGRALHGATEPIGKHKRITGIEQIDKAIAIDQKPIGRTPRSNPGTYTKLFDAIREVFAELPEARARGYDAGRFSFNVKGGRCEACSGDGAVKVEMHFLADVYVPCEICHGRRYSEETCVVRFKGKSIADILDTSVEECLSLFSAFPQARRMLSTLVDVGLGYMLVGQSAPTLSGGEAQRVKLARELGKSHTGRTLYVLDEPTTGLHFDDISKLLSVLTRLVDAGNSVIVIEHNLDVIRCADWVIDLGPEGGDGGGRIVAEGTPEQVAANKASFTGQFLAGAS